MERGRMELASVVSLGRVISSSHQRVYLGDVCGPMTSRKATVERKWREGNQEFIIFDPETQSGMSGHCAMQLVMPCLIAVLISLVAYWSLPHPRDLGFPSGKEAG